jgi:hypothetical protein
MVNCNVGVVAFALAGAVGSAGCGGGSGPAYPISTSVPGDKRLSDLTPAERTQYCVDVAAWAVSGPFLTDGCNLTSWLATQAQANLEPTATDAELRATCQGTHTACVANGVTSTCDTSTPTTCTATVAEYNRCLSDSLEAIGTLPPCSAVTRASLAPNIARVSGQPASAACVSVENKCPDLS